MINNPHLKSITDGIAGALLFLAVMGMAVDASLWPALLATVILSFAIHYMGKELFAYEPEKGRSRVAESRN